MYPILLDMRKRLVVMVGGGHVAARKAAELHRAGAEIIVISPELHPYIEALRGKIEIRQTIYVSGMLLALEQANDHPFLVFAATDSPEVNAQVTDEARDLGILVNTIDDGANGDFSNMGIIRRGDITIALATGGLSPALASHLRVVLQTVVGEEYATLARWLGELRPLIKGKTTPKARRALWRAIIQSSALEHLRAGDEAGARAVIDAIIEQANTDS